MNENYTVSDYGIFSDAISTTNKLKANVDTAKTTSNDVKTIIDDDAVFMGPCADSCVQAMTSLDSGMNTVTENFSTINNYLTEVATAYKNGDTAAANKVLSISGTQLRVSEGGNLTGNSNEEQVYNYLVSKGFSPQGAAGIMGNLQQESNFRADNVQNGMGYSDEDYVNGIKNGSISRDSFINDSRGFGIAQWTYPTRKAALYDYLGPENIDSLSGQLDFMIEEMGSGLTSDMKNASSASQAAAEFHNVYERSADANTSTREGYASNIYNKYNA